MAFDAVAAVRAVHVIAAALWVGGAFFMSYIFGPSIRAAGPAAGPVMTIALRRGGFGPFFGTVATIAVLSGGYIYSEYGFARNAFAGASNSLLTLGVLFALTAYVTGLAVVVPTEGKMKRLVRSWPANGPPPAEGVGQMQTLAAKQGKASHMAAGFLVLALLSMTLYKVF